MKIGRMTRLGLLFSRLVTLLAGLVILVLIAWLSTRYTATFEWSSAPPVAVAAGHGERAIDGAAPRDLNTVAAPLREWGHRLESVEGAIPDDARLLVIAGPRAPWPEGRQEAVRDWVEAGGSLLWLVDAGDERRLGALAEALPISVMPGTLRDPEAAEQLGADDGEPLVLQSYPRHPALQRLDGETLLMDARALELTDLDAGGWEVSQLLRSEARHERVVDNGDARGGGPWPLGLSLAREHADGEQRVAVIGSGAFAANAHVERGRNADLALQLVNWLSAGTQRGSDLALSREQTVVLGFGGLVVLPGLWFLGALWAGWRRRRG